MKDKNTLAIVGGGIPRTVNSCPEELKPGCLEQHNKQVPCVFSKRWILAYISFVSFIFMYAVRSDLSVAIVCMVKTNRSTASDLNITDPTCQLNANVTLGYERAEFDWGKDHQSGLLSAFYYGYIFAQIPGGWLAGRFGGKNVLGIGWTVGAIATILTPVSARTSIYIVYVIRVVLGLFTGISYPAMQTMWAKWAPPQERSKLAVLTYSGPSIGNIITFTMSGYLCADGFDNGWGSIFYVIGAANLLWVIVWFLCVAESPSSHSTMSDTERDYIVSSIGESTTESLSALTLWMLAVVMQMAVLIYVHDSSAAVQVQSTPWRHIFTSKAVYTCVVSAVCHDWVVFLLTAEMPTYLKEVLMFDVKSNGLLSSAPFLAMAFISISGSHVADCLRRRCLSTKLTRRVFQTTSFVGAGACLVGTGFVTCSNRHIAVVLLCAALGFMGLSTSGFMVNSIEFAPRYAGIVLGVANTFSTIPGMIAPIAVGALTPNKTQEEWKIVFYVCGGTAAFSALVFATLSEFEVQDWAGEQAAKQATFDKDIIEVRL